MNVQDPVYTIMSKGLHTLEPSDKLQQVKDVLDTFGIHHIPVVEEGKLVGIVSKSDLLYFLKATDEDSNEAYLNKIRLKNYSVAEAMSSSIVTVNADEPIERALEILSDNYFHAVPVLDKGKLAGIVTTHDIIYELLREKRMMAESNGS